MGSRLLYRELILSLKSWRVDAEISSLFERLVVESKSEIGGADGSRKSAETPAISFQVPRQQVYEPILLERGFRAGARKRALNCRAVPRSIFGGAARHAEDGLGRVGAW